MIKKVFRFHTLSLDIFSFSLHRNQSCSWIFYALIVLSSVQLFMCFVNWSTIYAFCFHSTQKKVFVLMIRVWCVNCECSEHFDWFDIVKIANLFVENEIFDCVCRRQPAAKKKQVNSNSILISMAIVWKRIVLRLNGVNVDESFYRWTKTYK